MFVRITIKFPYLNHSREDLKIACDKVHNKRYLLFEFSKNKTAAETHK